MDLFAKLKGSHVTTEDLQSTRIHKALLLITRAGSNWPEKLIEAADEVVDAWTRTCGPLETLRPDLFAPGARLDGIVTRRDDLSRQVRICFSQ